MSTLLTREAILERAATPPPRELLDVPDFGPVLVRGLTASEKNNIDGEQVRLETIKGVPTPRLHNERMTAKWLQLGMINEDGSSMFAPTDIPQLGKLPAKPAEYIADAIKRLSGSERGVTLEELKGNSAGESAT